MSDRDNKEDDVVFIEDGDETEIKVGKDETEASKPSGDPAVSERLARAEAEQRQISNHLLNLQSQLQNGSGNQPNQQDPYESELDNIAEQERALGIQFEALRASKGLNQQNIKEFDTKARSLAQRRSDISAERSLQRVMPQIVQNNQRAHFQSLYSDVMGNQAASTYAKGRYDMLRAMGEPDSPETVDKAMNDARIQFKMPGAKKFMPTDQDKNQLSGVGGGGGRATNTNVVKMGKAEKSMAMAMYGDRFNGDEKKAYAAWAKGPGLRANKAAAKGRRIG